MMQICKRQITECENCTFQNVEGPVQPVSTGPSTFRKVQFSITAKFRPRSVLKMQRKNHCWSLHVGRLVVTQQVWLHPEEFSFSSYQSSLLFISFYVLLFFVHSKVFFLPQMLYFFQCVRVFFLSRSNFVPCICSLYTQGPACHHLWNGALTVPVPTYDDACGLVYNSGFYWGPGQCQFLTKSKYKKMRWVL